MALRSLRTALPWQNAPFRTQIRSYAERRRRIPIPIQPAAFPVVETCPSPTCHCRPMPEGLDIDRETPLNGTMAAYAEQVLISTGMHDWKSRIEDEEDATFVKELKELLGRRGKFSDPFHNVMITNSSFAKNPDPSLASAYLFPSFRYVPAIPISKPSVEEFVKGFVLPETPHRANQALPEEQRTVLTRDASLQKNFRDVRAVDEVVVLICGHGGRDERCGILGPLLQFEFEDQLQRNGFAVSKEGDAQAAGEDGPPRAHVGLISHIGGHKYAGNVIIYLPPTMKDHSLAGKGIWYGRVGTGQVEGIVKNTILGGHVIKDMFRGGIEQGGDVLRL